MKLNLEAIRTALAEKSLARFMKQAWHVIEPNAELIWGRYNDALCDHLEAVSRGDIQNLLITIPPGCTKSVTVSVCWPAWTWISDPSIRWLTAANDRDLVLRDAVSCRELIRSEWYQARWRDRFKLAYDQDVKNWYKNDQKGFRTAVTVGQRVTGKKGDIQIIDDPDDAMNVRSKVERDKIHNWFDKAFYNRVNNHKTARRVVIGQCLDVDDLIAHIKKRGDFVHLNLPEEFEPSRKCQTSIGWKDWRSDPGELLRPEMFGPQQVKEAKMRLRTSYEAQHNQNPISEGGIVFKAEWLRYYTALPGGQFWMFGETAYEPKEIVDRFLTVDPAFTVKKTAKHDPDYFVISAWGRTRCGKLVWLACLRLRCEMPDAPNRIAEMYARWDARSVEIEANGPQKGFFDLCRRHPSHMNCIAFPPEGQRMTDKLDASIDLQSLAEAGRLWLPANDPTFPLGEVETEILVFTGDKKKDAHDDIVTTASIAAKRVSRKDGTPKRVQMIGSGKRQGPLR